MKQYYLSYRPRTECGISQFFKTNCTQSIFRTINRGLLAKPFKKFPKSPIRPAGSHFWQAPNFQWTLNELRFNIIKNLLCLFFLLNGFITMCNLKKRLIRAAFWVLLQAMFMNDWKQTAQRWKMQERLLTINKRNIIWRNIYRYNYFHSRRQVFKDKDPDSSSLKLKFMFYAGFPVFAFFKDDWTRSKKIAQSFLVQPEL